MAREFHAIRHAGLEAVIARSSRRFPRHTHDTFGIGVVTEGAQVSASRKGPVEAGPGDVITVEPGEIHDGAPIGAARAWRIVYIDQPAVASCVADMFGAGGLRAPALRDKVLAREAHALFAAVASAAPMLAVEERLFRVMALAFDRRPRIERHIPAGIAMARARLDDDPQNAPSLAALASLAGLGRFQLLRGFSRTTGLTPHAYLRQRRATLARRLLAGGIPPAEAALAAGFADQSHLTRVFARFYGMTPGAYARR